MILELCLFSCDSKEHSGYGCFLTMLKKSERKWRENEEIERENGERMRNGDAMEKIEDMERG